MNKFILDKNLQMRLIYFQMLSSINWLLQERQVDPEEVLHNLGFGGGNSQSVTMYSRIPDRFLHSQTQAIAPIEEERTSDIVENTPKNSSRGQCFISDFNSLDDNEFHTYILNRVPSYYFRENAIPQSSSFSE